MKNIFLTLIVVFASLHSKAQCVNFTKYQPAGWDNSIVISAVTGTNTSETGFYENQTLYLDIAIINNGSCNATQTVTANVFLDGVFKTTITYPILNANFYGYTLDYMISGTLSPGNHTILVNIDNPSVIAETNESDNNFSRTFTVQQGACVSTPISTIWNGNRTFNTEHYLANNFRIKDQCQASILTIRHWNSTTLTSNPLEIESPTNSWNSTGNQQWGGSTMWAAKSSYNYFSGVHSRNSYDGANGWLNGFIHGVFDNAGGSDNATMSFTGGIMKIGLGSSGTLANSYGTLDIVGHEYAHAVTGSSAALAYQYESGALNESFSDIFGECIENYTLGNNDWLLGANRTPAGPIRSMSNPNAYSQPDTYLGTNWYAQNCPSPTNANDQCGVHFNSGVQNYWFYLLSQGGTGTNDINNAFNVPALGITKARAIAFRTLTINLFNQPNAIYLTARTASIQSAQEIYGANTPEVNAVINAWCAVGIGTAPTVTVSGGGTFCTSTTINASGGAGGTIYYQGTNSNGTSTSSTANSQTITTSGTYYFRAQNGCGWGPSVGVTVIINNVPAAISVSGSGGFCNSTTISATGGAGGTIYYQGTNSNGTSTSTPSTSQTITTSGTYYFRAQNGCGWGVPVGVTVTINTVPATVSVPGGGTFCNAVILNATGGAGGVIYFQGTNSNGTSTANATSSFTVNASGTYYFRSGNLCGWGPSGSVTVTVVPEPGPVTVSGGGTFCNSATINASGGAGGTIYWQGTTTGGTSTNTPSTSQVITSSGTYYFRVRNATCGWGPQGSTTVNIQNTPAAVAVSGGGTFCNSTTITASGGVGGTIYFQGTTSNGTSFGSTSLSQVPTSSGTYYFRSYNSTCGWGTQGSATVTINLPASVSVFGGGTFCNSANLSATSGNGGTIYYQGSTSLGTSTTIPVATQISVSSSGTHFFRVLNGCGWGPEASASVTINTIPSTVTVSGAGAFCTNRTLIATGGSGGTIYWQNTTNGGTSTTTPSSSQLVNASGTYYFRAYNSCGWSSQGSATVSMLPNSLNLTGNSVNGLQKAKIGITSNQTITSGMNVTYEAGKSIELAGLFSAANGSVFKAEIKACN